MNIDKLPISFQYDDIITFFPRTFYGDQIMCTFRVNTRSYTELVYHQMRPPFEVKDNKGVRYWVTKVAYGDSGRGGKLLMTKLK